MLAQVAADGFQLGKDFVVPLAIGAAGGVIALVGQFFLQRAGLFQRFGESLWQERLNAYQELISVLHEATVYIFSKTPSEFNRDGFFDFMHNLSIRLIRCRAVSSREVDRALLVHWTALLDFSLDNAEAHLDQILQTRVALTEAIRGDLRIEHLGEQANEWFRRLPPRTNQ